MTEPEQLILGAILLHEESLAMALEAGLTAADFKDPRCGEAYDALLTLGAAGKPIDLTSLKEQLGIPFEDREASAFISSLIDGIPRSSNIPHYARIVKYHAACRRGENPEEPEII